MEEVTSRRKKRRMCPRESSQGNKNEMLNQPKCRSQRTLGLLKIGDRHLHRKRIPVGSSFQADVPDWTGLPSISKQYSDDKEDVDDLKWFGTHVLDWAGLNKQSSDDKEDVDHVLPEKGDDGIETNKSTEKVYSVKEGADEEEGGTQNSIDCWWDDEKKKFTFKINNTLSYVPWYKVPSMINQQNLERFTENALFCLQSHLASRSVMVGRFISEKAASAKSSLEARERDNKKLKKIITSLKDKLRKTEKALSIEKSKSLEELKVKVACDNIVFENNCSEMERLKGMLESERQASKVEIESLKKQLEDLKLALVPLCDLIKKL